ncbi:MAG: phosphate ABC transporter substrate-binding protein [Methanobrevibacter sp.]|nr:phosphate ABC transporter substrate-binding protein [Candidatus Methanoflexus mossambicus]
MKSKIKIIIGIIILIAIIIIMINPGNNYQRIEIVGSTSVQPVAEELANAFVENKTDIKINVQGGGSSLGITSVEQAISDIGMSSMDINNSYNFTKYLIGYDGILVCVNNENNINDLSSEQIKNIFSGSVDNWKEVGGENKEIHVMTREEGSGTRSEFERIIMKDDEIKADAIVQSSTEAVKQSVASDSGAIGFISYAHMSDDVKAIKLDGVMATDETIADGTYTLKIPFLFITKGEKTGMVSEFLDWLNSSTAKEIIQSKHIVLAK